MSIPNQFLTIKLDNAQIQLSKGVSIFYAKTNLPKHAFNFKTHEPIFWKLEQKHYDPASGTLTVNVIEYDLPSGTVLAEQLPTQQITNLHFEKLDWKKFEPLIYSYTLSQLKGITFNHTNSFLDLSDGKNETVKSLKQTAPNLFFSKREPIKEDIELEINIKYEDAKFENKNISFSVHLKLTNQVQPVEIANHHLRAEFEYIKPYFIKRLGKSFRSKIKLKLLDNRVEEIIATSEDIDAINETLIDSIKIDSALNLQHFKTARKEKILYTAKDLSAEDKGLSLLNMSANDILEIFIENANVRNIKQMEFLARERQTLNERLQFTIKPLFGFVFYELHKNHCFIWELLNSHATYVWKIGAAEDRSQLNEVVEQAIATIKTQGRQAYKNYYRSLGNTAYNFGVIEHSSSNLTEDERFHAWRKKLEIFCA